MCVLRLHSTLQPPPPPIGCTLHYNPPPPLAALYTIPPPPSLLQTRMGTSSVHIGFTSMQRTGGKPWPYNTEPCTKLNCSILSESSISHSGHWTQRVEMWTSMNHAMITGRQTNKYYFVRYIRCCGEYHQPIISGDYSQLMMNVQVKRNNGECVMNTWDTDGSKLVSPAPHSTYSTYSRMHGGQDT